MYDLDMPPVLDKKFRHNIDVVVDRIVVREGMETRLADSFRTALDLGGRHRPVGDRPEGGRGGGLYLLGTLRLSGQRVYHPGD